MYDRFRWTRKSDWRNRLSRAYEPFQPYLLSALAEAVEATVFVDVGANIGLYSLFLTRCDNIREVHAFEAMPATFAELQQNVALNGLPVATYQKALSDTDGEVRFGVIGDLSGANSVVDGSIHSDKFSRFITVEAARLDDCLSTTGEIVVIKIDVEGHEPQVIRGAEALLRNNTVVLQVELYGGQEETAGLLADMGLRQLCRIGPDTYFSNSPRIARDSDVIAAFERASVLLRQEAQHSLSLAFPANAPHPLKVRIPGVGHVQLEGNAARLARAGKAMIPFRR